MIYEYDNSVENNDGGSFWGFFDAKTGNKIATSSQSESGEPDWDK
jgi:hypothetical protein